MRDLLEGGVAPSGRNWPPYHLNGVQLQTAGAQIATAKVHFWPEVDANIHQYRCIWMKLEKLQRSKVNRATWHYIKDNSVLRFSGFAFGLLPVHSNCLSYSDYGLSERMWVTDAYIFSLCTTGSYIIQEMAMQRDHGRPIIRRYKKTVFTNFSNNVTESLSSCWGACKPILRTASTTENNIDMSALRATFWTTLVCLKLVKSIGALLVTFSYTSKYSVAIFAYSSKAIVRRKKNKKQESSFTIVKPPRRLLQCAVSLPFLNGL